MGRDPDCDIQLMTGSASRRHCLIKDYGDEAILIKDLNSSNGTHVDGAMVTSALLSPGQSFSVGDSILEFYQGEAKGTNSPTMPTFKLSQGAARTATFEQEMSEEDRMHLRHIAVTLRHRRSSVRCTCGSAAAVLSSHGDLRCARCEDQL